MDDEEGMGEGAPDFGLALTLLFMEMGHFLSLISMPSGIRGAGGENLISIRSYVVVSFWRYFLNLPDHPYRLVAGICPWSNINELRTARVF